MRSMGSCGLTSCCLVLALTSSTSGAEFAWMPAGATGGYTIDESTITLQRGGQVVTLELHLRGWGGAAGNPSLGTYQATVDSSGYSSGAGDPLIPVGWPDSPADGAFIDVDHTNPDYVFLGFSSIPAVSTASLDYEFGAVIFGGSKVDDGLTYYCVTLRLEVPAGAAGIYTVDFVDQETKTFLRDGGANPIFPVNLHPAVISVGVTCMTDEDCNDDNACTIDVCVTDECQYSNAPAGTTCREAAGECDLEETCPGNSPVCPGDEVASAGTECRPAMGLCDIAEVCDGVSVACPPDTFEPSGIPCLDDGDECTEDICDGMGECIHSRLPDCYPEECRGDADCDDNDVCTDDECDSGACVYTNSNDPCDDRDACTTNDRCVDGSCVGGAPRDCDDERACTEDSCDPAQGCINLPKDSDNDGVDDCEDQCPNTWGDQPDGCPCVGCGCGGVGAVGMISLSLMFLGLVRRKARVAGRRSPCPCSL